MVAFLEASAAISEIIVRGVINGRGIKASDLKIGFHATLKRDVIAGDGEPAGSIHFVNANLVAEDGGGWQGGQHPAIPFRSATCELGAKREHLGGSLAQSCAAFRIGGAIGCVIEPGIGDIAGRFADFHRHRDGDTTGILRCGVKLQQSPWNSAIVHWIMVNPTGGSGISINTVAEVDREACGAKRADVSLTAGRTNHIVYFGVLGGEFFHHTIHKLHLLVAQKCLSRRAGRVVATRSEAAHLRIRVHAPVDLEQNILS